MPSCGDLAQSRFRRQRTAGLGLHAGVVGLRGVALTSPTTTREMNQMMKLRPIAKAVLLVFPSGLALGAASIASAQEAQSPPKAADVRDSIVVTATKREVPL